MEVEGVVGRLRNFRREGMVVRVKKVVEEMEKRVWIKDAFGSKDKYFERGKFSGR